MTTINKSTYIDLSTCIQQIQKNGIWYDTYEVTPESVGQFTGLFAENCKSNLEKEIYDGDLFREERETNEGDVVLYYVVTWIDQRGAFYLIPEEQHAVITQNDVSKEKEFDWLFEDANLYDFSLDIGLTKVGNIHEKEVDNANNR